MTEAPSFLLIKLSVYIWLTFFTFCYFFIYFFVLLEILLKNSFQDFFLNEPNAIGDAVNQGLKFILFPHGTECKLSDDTGLNRSSDNVMIPARSDPIVR